MTTTGTRLTRGARTLIFCALVALWWTAHARILAAPGHDSLMPMVWLLLASVAIVGSGRLAGKMIRERDVICSAAAVVVTLALAGCSLWVVSIAAPGSLRVLLCAAVDVTAVAAATACGFSCPRRALRRRIRWSRTGVSPRNRRTRSPEPAGSRRRCRLAHASVWMVCMACVLGSSVWQSGMAAAVDLRLRPDKLHTDARPDLGLRFHYPAVYELVEAPRESLGRDGLLLRLGLVAHGEHPSSVIVTVRAMALKDPLTRAVAAELIQDVGVLAKGALHRQYSRRDGVSKVTKESLGCVAFTGLPALRYRADLVGPDGTVVKLERRECLNGRVSLTIETAYGAGDTPSRRRLRRILRSFHMDPAWPIEGAPAGDGLMASHFVGNTLEGQYSRRD